MVVRGEFELSDEEMRQIEAAFGEGVLRSPRVTVSKDYANRRHWEVEVDEDAVGGAAVAGPSGDGRAHVTDRIVGEYLERFLPLFVYFDDYSAMRGRISIQDLRRLRDGEGPLDDADRTFLALLSLVSAELEDFEDQTNYEHLKTELEAASIGISDEIFRFWNQNRELRVEFDLSSANPNDRPPLNSGTILHLRIWNERHRVSVQFDERSKASCGSSPSYPTSLSWRRRRRATWCCCWTSRASTSMPWPRTTSCASSRSVWRPSTRWSTLPTLPS